jgi:hypothetical protein
LTRLGKVKATSSFRSGMNLVLLAPWLQPGEFANSSKLKPFQTVSIRFASISTGLKPRC